MSVSVTVATYPQFYDHSTATLMRA